MMSRDIEPGQDTSIDPVEVLRSVYYVGSEIDAPVANNDVLKEFLPTLMRAAQNGPYTYSIDLYDLTKRLGIWVMVEARDITDDLDIDED